MKKTGILALSTLWVFLALVRGEASEPAIGGLGDEGPSSDRVKGEVLIRELGCAHCHADLEERFAPRGGTNLALLGSRVTSSYLRRFLENPRASKPGTVMPDLLSQVPEAERGATVDALTHFLSASRHETTADAFPTQNGDAERGKALFDTIGCAACHSNEGSEIEALPFEGLAEKYSFDKLVNYLLDPLATDSSARMPDMHLGHSEAVDLSRFLLGSSPIVSDPKLQDEELMERGRILFAELGCSACHPGSDNASQTQLELTMDASRSDRGCLSGINGMWPDYALSKAQRRVIQVALSSSDPLTSEQLVEVGLRQFNCVACHDRDGYGGVTGERDAYFSSHDPNLGEQGRIPPSLDGVGAKLKPTWLRRILVQGAPARPYMKTRMPRFAGKEIDQLIDSLLKQDQLPEVEGVTFEERNLGQRTGRDLVGSDGLSCITCHTFKETQVGAMGALDLTLMAQRVTRKWFHHYMREPLRFSPETLMPGFWPGGESPLPEILDGDVLKQIESLWVYTSEGYGMGAPKGLRREPMKLLAKNDEAVMLRRSYPGIGKRGIGVGYPGDVNLVYHAEQLCLSLLWKGGFVDPSGVWMSQGHGTARPLSRDVLRFENAPELFALSSSDAPWPPSDVRSPEHRFKGYSLDAHRKPTFRYEYKGIKVEDHFEPSIEGGQRGMKRTLHFNSDVSVPGLTFRIGKGASILPIASRRFQIGEQMEIVIVSGGESYLITSAEGKELRVSVVHVPGVDDSQLVLRYVF